MRRQGRISALLPAALITCTGLVLTGVSLSACDINSCRDGSVCGKSNDSNGVNAGPGAEATASAASSDPTPFTLTLPQDPVTTSPAAHGCHNTLTLAARTGMAFSIGVSIPCPVPPGKTLRIISEIINADGHGTTLDYVNPCLVHSGTQLCPSHVSSPGIQRFYFLVSTTESQWATIATTQQGSGYNASSLMAGYAASDRYPNIAG
jgi:hypothetical protein